MPLVQIKNVLWEIFVSASVPVTPVMALSFTDHSFKLPSQPVRSSPLKMLRKPGSAALLGRVSNCTTDNQAITIRDFRISKTLGRCRRDEHSDRPFWLRRCVRALALIG